MRTFSIGPKSGHSVSVRLQMAAAALSVARLVAGIGAPVPLVIILTIAACVVELLDVWVGERSPDRVS
jgi:hypothetical protein